MNYCHGLRVVVGIAMSLSSTGLVFVTASTSREIGNKLLRESRDLEKVILSLSWQRRFVTFATFNCFLRNETIETCCNRFLDLLWEV